MGAMDRFEDAIVSRSECRLTPLFVSKALGRLQHAARLLLAYVSACKMEPVCCLAEEIISPVLEIPVNYADRSPFSGGDLAPIFSQSEPLSATVVVQLRISSVSHPGMRPVQAALGLKFEGPSWRGPTNGAFSYEVGARCAVLCELIVEPIKQSGKLIGEPIKDG